MNDASDLDSARMPDYLEKTQSQLPALEFLIKMGWEYLPPERAVELRNGRLGTAILDSVLAEHIRRNCRFEFKGSMHLFTENAVQNAVQELKAFRGSGALSENEEVYDLLCLGVSLPQTVEGDTKSFNINYIDWKNPENNTYQCTAEFKVERVGHQEHRIPDIVLFVNGIPLVVIECKRGSYTDVKKDPIQMAIQQFARNQRNDEIPQLFLYSQIHLALARNRASYGTTGTKEKFWTVWCESGTDEDIEKILGISLSSRQQETLLSGQFTHVRGAYSELLSQGRSVYEQDRLLYAVCRKERLLELVYKFILFDKGVKKIARYQQYFTVKDILDRVVQSDRGETRAGGVVWHTQGSGKSLTMVMLAKSLVLHPLIRNPRVILVTDRINLDKQICDTFRHCGLLPEKAKTGKHLLKLLREDKTQVVTTVINKFAAAVSASSEDRDNSNTFVLVDEGHRGQYSELHALMKLSLKGACFIAFTGTPLAKNDKRNTFRQFGKMFKPAYTITRAVDDKAIVPLLYEGRYVPQSVDRKTIDSWFEKVTSDLTEKQRSDIKKKFSTEKQLNKAEQKVRMVAWDIGKHYSTTYQGTGLKGQLVAPDKATALRYKSLLDEFGMVSSEVLISPPDVSEGEYRGAVPSGREEEFWREMMNRFGTEKEYNERIIESFIYGEEPEIIIVVDKLLTGFDAPPNTVLYLTRKLKEHTLLQAIARVNRLYDGKEYGLILDYSGVLKELDEAIDFYSQLVSYDMKDLEGTVTYVSKEIEKLQEYHRDLQKVFYELKGSLDPEAYEVSLRDEEKRQDFYKKFSSFALALGLALSSSTFFEETSNEKILVYKRDLKFYSNLRAAVTVRFQEVIDFSEYEPRIQKLIDTHVGAGEVERLHEQVDIFDTSSRVDILEDKDKSAGTKADMIASATRHVIQEEMSRDPAFYRKFSEMLEEVIEGLRLGLFSETEALEKINGIADKVTTHTDDSVPAALAGDDMARRYYGVIRESDHESRIEELAVDISLEISKRLKMHRIRDWITNPDVIKRMKGEIEDLILDLSSEYGVYMAQRDKWELIDTIVERCIEVAIANEEK